MNIADYIPYGRDNAVTREQLAEMTGRPDRAIREMIERARRGEDVIISMQDGRGYYKSDDIDEIEHYYRQEHRRALSILRRLKSARRKLKNAGRKV